MAAIVGVLALVLALAGTASAHPLGNFTTNGYQEVVASGDRVFVLSVLDLAEIPTFQAKSQVARIGRSAYAASLAAKVRAGLELRVDGTRRPLAQLESRLIFRDGAAGLRTTRLELVFGAGRLQAGTHRLELRDTGFAGRLGWREIVLRADGGASLAGATAPAQTGSDRLRTYPKNQLQSPPDVRLASARVTAGDGVAVAPTFDPAPVASGQGSSEGGFASLVEREDLSVGFVLLALVLAMFWGAAHALTPGHGKAIVAAYLVGTKGRPRDALALGGIVTVTHTIGVFTLGLITLGLSEFIVPEDLYPWLNVISAVLVVAVGVTVLRQRVRAAAASGRGHDHDHDHHHHGHAHGHGHHHHHEGMTDEEHARAHLPAPGSGTRGLLAVGISGGLLPCPTALVVLLAAISLHRVAFGLVLILAFSVGLAAVISAIGLLAIGARQTFKQVSFEGRVVRALPAVSALLILVIGVAMTVRALPSVV